MKILAFDTSTKFLTIACLEDKAVKSSFHKDVGIEHSELLVSTIEKCLKKMQWKISDIELVCVGLGPGSFTGLRIALAAVKGFAAVLPMKVLGVPTMDAIIKNIPLERCKFAAPLLDARKGKVYTCIYDVSKTYERTTDYILTDIASLSDGLDKKVLFFGDAVGKYKKELESSAFAEYDEDIDWFPRADEIGRIGFERSLKGTDDPEKLEPLYLHPKECSIKQLP